MVKRFIMLLMVLVMLGIPIHADTESEFNVSLYIEEDPEDFPIYNEDLDQRFLTFHDAIQGSNPHDTLIIDEGSVFNETVIIDIPINIIGNGAVIHGESDKIFKGNYVEHGVLVQPRVENKLLTTDNLWVEPALSSGFESEDGECAEYDAWDENTVYMSGEQVVHNHVIYTSQINDNTDEPPTNWNEEYSCGYDIEAILESEPYDHHVYWYGEASQENVIIGKDFGEPTVINSFTISTIDLTGSPSYVYVEASHDNSSWEEVYDTSLSYPRWESSNNPTLPVDQVEHRTWNDFDEYRYWRLRFTDQTGSSFMRINEVVLGAWDYLSDVSLNDIVIDKQNVGDSGSGLRILRSRGEIEIDNMQIQNIAGNTDNTRHGIFVGDGSRGLSITNTIIDNIEGTFSYGIQGSSDECIECSCTVNVENVSISNIDGQISSYGIQSSMFNSCYENIHIENISGGASSSNFGIQLINNFGNEVNDISITNLTGNQARGLHLQYSANNTIQNLDITDVFGNLAVSVIEIVRCDYDGDNVCTENNLIENVNIDNIESSLITRAFALQRGVKNTTLRNFNVTNINGTGGNTFVGAVQGHADHPITHDNLIENIMVRGVTTMTAGFEGIRFTNDKLENNTLRGLDFVLDENDDISGVSTAIDVSDEGTGNIVEDSHFEGFDVGVDNVHAEIISNILLQNRVQVIDDELQPDTLWDTNYMDFAGFDSGNVMTGSIPRSFEVLFGVVDPTNPAVAQDDITMKVRDNDIVHFVNVDNSTEIARDDDSIDIHNIIAEVITDTNIIDDFRGGFRFGDTEEPLYMDTPIVINIMVDADDGTELEVLKSDDLDTWTTDGIVNSTCVVDDGYCSFETESASYFVVVGEDEVTELATGGSGVTEDEEVEDVEITLRQPQDFLSVVTGTVDETAGSRIQLDSYEHSITLFAGDTRTLRIPVYNLDTDMRDLEFEVLREGQHRWLDILNERDMLRIPSRSDRDLEIEVSVPSGTDEGRYHGYLTIVSDNNKGEIEVIINVRNREITMWWLVLIGMIAVMLLVIISTIFYRKGKRYRK